MAVPAIAARQRETARGQLRKLADGATAWRTTLSPESYPALDEHRLGEVPVMPASGHLDVIVRAFALC